MTARVPRPERRIYAWPEVPNLPVLLPYSRKDARHWNASTRVLSAARMVCYCRWSGWKPHVKSTPEGVLFWWECEQ